MSHLKDIFKTAQTDNFLDEVAKNNIPGHYLMRKFFNNPNQNTGLADIWGYGGTVAAYNYTAPAGADYYIASSNAGDTQQIRIHLLDENFSPRVITKTLTGQTPVKINDGFSCTRVYRLVNIGAANIAGTVYCAETPTFVGGVPTDTSKVQAIISGANNQSLMSHFTIPAGHYGLVYNFAASITNRVSLSADISVWIRNFGGVFRIQDTKGFNAVGTGYGIDPLIIPGLVGPKSDIKVRGIADGACGVSGFYVLIVVEEKYVNKAYSQLFI